VNPTFVERENSSKTGRTPDEKKLLLEMKAQVEAAAKMPGSTRA